VVDATLSWRTQPYPRVASNGAPVSATYPAGTAEVAGWKLTFATGVGVCACAAVTTPRARASTEETAAIRVTRFMGRFSGS
jgi:hypothetical protein